MKKITSILLSLAILFTFCSVNVFSASTIDGYDCSIVVDKTTDIKAGDTINVKVVLNTTENVSNAKFKLKFDTSLFPIEDWSIIEVTNRFTWNEVETYGSLNKEWADDFFYNAGTDVCMASGLYGDISCMITELDDGVYCQFIHSATEPMGTVVSDYVLLSLDLVAASDITDLTTFELVDAVSTVFVDGVVPTDAEFTASTTVGGTSATATPEPTAAPTAAPEIVLTETTSNNVTSATVAEKAFVAFATIANYTVTDNDEYGILVASGDSVDEAAAKNGTAYVAKGNIDGKFGIKVINGGNPDEDPDYVDGFEANSIGYIPYLKIGDQIFYGEFKTLK